MLGPRLLRRSAAWHDLYVAPWIVSRLIRPGQGRSSGASKRWCGSPRRIGMCGSGSQEGRDGPGSFERVPADDQSFRDPDDHHPLGRRTAVRRHPAAASQLAAAVFETADADHGRLELRRHWVSHDVSWLFSDRRYAGEPVMPGLATIARVEAERTVDGRTSRAVRYYLSSAHLLPEHLAKGRARPLGDREQPPLGARRHLRRGSRPKPQGQRPGEPRHPAQAHPQPAAKSPAQAPRRPKTKSAPDGPTPSHALSSAKCDSPGAASRSD